MPETIGATSQDEIGELFSLSSDAQLWTLLRILVHRLLHNTIFCVLDRLAFYHDSREALFLIQGLSQLIHELPPHVVVKVLLTGPLPCEVVDILSMEQLLYLPVTVDGDDQGFTMSRGYSLLNMA